MLRLRLAVLAVIVVGGATLIWLFAWPRGHAAAACSPRPVGALSAAATRQLAADGRRIQHIVDQSSGGGHDETWFDPVTGRMRTLSFDSTGALTSEEGSTWRGRVRTTVHVDLVAHTWSAAATRFPAPYSGADNGAQAAARVMRDEIAHGFAVPAEHAVIDGREMLHLRETLKLAPPTPQTLGFPYGSPGPEGTLLSSPSQVDVWVDPATYLIVRVQTADSSVWESEWLPRTPTSVAETAVVVPAAFAQRPAPAPLTTVTGGTYRLTETRCSQA